MVNNAGLALGRDAIQDVPDADIDVMVQTNVLAVLRLCKAVIPSMIAKKSGHIINLGSVAGESAYKGGVVYCASKAAVHMMTESLREDLGGTGVRVSTIAPGRVETEFSLVRYKGDHSIADPVCQGYRLIIPVPDQL